MSNVARVYRPGSAVEHLGVYAVDYDAGQYGHLGRYVPICGQERRHDRGWRLATWNAPLAPPAQRRLCTRCALLIEELVALADLQPGQVAS